MFSYAFLAFFLVAAVAVFHCKSFVFIIFISFFDEAPNFLNRILTNQKQELVIKSSQWNCMLYLLLKCINSASYR